MARRRPPATTAFGAWLSAWLDENPKWTVEALADRVGASPAAVSLWLTKTKKVGVRYLQAVSEVTGEPFDNLQRMVYGGAAPYSGAALSADLLDAIEERMRRAFREELQAALRDAGLAR